MENTSSTVSASDQIADEVVADLRWLAGVWWREGSTALEATIRRDPNLSYALLNSRSGTQGCIKLEVARSHAPSGIVRLEQPMGPGTPYMTIVDSDVGEQEEPVIWSLCISATQEQVILARGYSPLLLVADPALNSVGIGPAGDALVDEVALRLGVSARDQIDPPPYTEFSDDGDLNSDVWRGGQRLLEILDIAARMLDGRLSYIAGARAIATRYDNGGWPDADPAIRTMCVTDAQIRDPTGFQRMPAEPRCGPSERGARWSLVDELARVEAWAHERCQPACLSLIHHFRGLTFM